MTLTCKAPGCEQKAVSPTQHPFQFCPHCGNAYLKYRVYPSEIAKLHTQAKHFEENLNTLFVWIILISGVLGIYLGNSVFFNPQKPLIGVNLCLIPCYASVIAFTFLPQMITKRKFPRYYETK